MDDKDRKQIREELSHMNFQDLQKLKERLGTKLYNETVFGKQSKRKTEFKRENKNRPREMSAKKPISKFIKEVITTRKVEHRDPRFDKLCGTFDEKAFKHSYAFINELRENDITVLKTELKQATDPKTVKKIKYLIQRLENQLREEKRLKQKKEKQNLEKKEILQSIKRGEKPVFKKKSEKKMLELVSQYEELRNTGKLKRHIQRLRKKQIRKDKTKLRIAE